MLHSQSNGNTTLWGNVSIHDFTINFPKYNKKLYTIIKKKIEKDKCRPDSNSKNVNCLKG